MPLAQDELDVFLKAKAAFGRDPRKTFDLSKLDEQRERFLIKDFLRTGETGQHSSFQRLGLSAEGLTASAPPSTPSEVATVAPPPAAVQTPTLPAVQASPLSQALPAPPPQALPAPILPLPGPPPKAPQAPGGGGRATAVLQGAAPAGPALEALEAPDVAGFQAGRHLGLRRLGQRTLPDASRALSLLEGRAF